MVDAGRTVMFSSDYPHWDFDNPRMALAPIRKDLRGRILADNAIELYGLQSAPETGSAAAESSEGGDRP